MKKNLILFISKYNLFTGQVEKIIKDSKYNTIVLNIEGFVEKNKKLILNNHDVVYFICCNSPIIDKAILLIKGGYIINKSFLLSNYKKSDIQRKLNSNTLLIPKIYNVDDINNINFPIFCKENIHEGITIQIFNKISLKKFFEKFNKNDFYLEESLINTIDIKAEEFKIYYVNKNVYLKSDKISKNKELNELAIKISNILDNMDIYSCDIICQNNLYYIIDLNASAGFYLSDKSRQSFLDFVGEK